MKPGSKLVAGSAAAAVIALAATIVKPWEGLENDPYKDIVGVLTVCYGETKGVQMRHYSDAECSDMLMRRLGEFHREVAHCVPDEAPIHVKAAVLSFAYNVGSDAMCKSTLSRKLMSGDIAGACAELSRWVIAGGRRVQGLVNRRNVERALCEGRRLMSMSLGAVG